MRTDIAVIGGGAIGAAVAYYLRLLDPSSDVIVVERDPTYALASTPRASGGVRRLFSVPENIELSNYSIPFLRDFAETMAVDGVPADIGFHQNGYLFIVPPADVKQLRRNYEIQLEHGCNVVLIEPDQLKRLVRVRPPADEDESAQLASEDALLARLEKPETWTPRLREAIDRAAVMDPEVKRKVDAFIREMGLRHGTTVAGLEDVGLIRVHPDSATAKLRDAALEAKREQEEAT